MKKIPLEITIPKIIFQISSMFFIAQFVLAFFGWAIINGFVALISMVACFGLAEVITAVEKEFILKNINKDK